MDVIATIAEGKLVAVVMQTQMVIES